MNETPHAFFDVPRCILFFSLIPKLPGVLQPCPPALLRRVFFAERGEFAAPFVHVEAGGFAGAGGEVGEALDAAQAAAGPLPE